MKYMAKNDASYTMWPNTIIKMPPVGYYYSVVGYFNMRWPVLQFITIYIVRWLEGSPIRKLVIFPNKHFDINVNNYNNIFRSPYSNYCSNLANLYT